MTITKGDAAVFKFEAYDFATNQPGVIDQIVIDADGAGQVHILVAGNPSAGRIDGARDVKRIDLTRAGSSRIVALNITGSLGELGTTIAQSIDSSAGIPPSFTVDGSLLAGISVNACAANLSIGGNSAGLNLGAMTGNITIGGNLNGITGVDA